MYGLLQNYLRVRVRNGTLPTHSSTNAWHVFPYKIVTTKDQEQFVLFGVIGAVILIQIMASVTFNCVMTNLFLKRIRVKNKIFIQTKLKTIWHWKALTEWSSKLCGFYLFMYLLMYISIYFGEKQNLQKEELDYKEC